MSTSQQFGYLEAQSAHTQAGVQAFSVLSLLYDLSLILPYCCLSSGVFALLLSYASCQI